jgi:hypothetical protein
MTATDHTARALAARDAVAGRLRAHAATRPPAPALPPMDLRPCRHGSSDECAACAATYDDAGGDRS